MVTLIGAIYVFTGFCMIVFHVTRRELMTGRFTVGSRKEKVLHGLNLVSVGSIITWILLISTLEIILITAPVHLWEVGSEFMNQAIEFNSFYSVTMLSMTIAGLFVAGYTSDSRASYMPVNSVKGKWWWFLVCLLMIDGILGLITNLFI
ncbi:MAG: hypothetical protein ACFFFK_01470 [Candidatus Thorarchaeota archaeon]